MHKLEIIAKDVKECQKCELCKTRTNAVPGKGRFDADVMFVGEAPGRNEDNHGEPFVGAAGKRLDMILEDTGINREEVYITNIVKCRPPNNRVPSKKEEEACNGFINQEIEIINPKIISPFIIQIPVDSHFRKSQNLIINKDLLWQFQNVKHQRPEEIKEDLITKFLLSI